MYSFSRFFTLCTLTLFIVLLSSLGIACDKGNCENGKGIATYRGGDNWTLTVEGVFVNGEFVKGKATFSDTGDVWEGTFVNGIPEGQGTLTLKIGDKIFCDFVKGTCPTGKRVYSNGNQYEGEFKDGDADIKNGKGILTYADGSRYEGTWKNNKLDGPVKYIKADKTVYAQNFNNGELVSEKKVANSNNKKTAEKLDECVEGNCINGKGKKVWSNGRVYIGDFKNGLRDGNGINEINGHRYEGDWKEGKLNGQGKMTYKNGRIYEGEWKDNNKQGKGILFYKNGKIYYEGEFKNGEFHGQGKMTWPTGEVYEGEFKNGSRIVKAVEFDPKKYWEGALNCYRYTDNPAKESQRGYIDQLVNSVEIYKNSNSSSAKDDIFMYSNMIVENLGCSKDLFK